ncbi:hypothetical protein ES703_69580 [subsurface metagenome]
MISGKDQGSYFLKRKTAVQLIYDLKDNSLHPAKMSLVRMFVDQFFLIVDYNSVHTYRTSVNADIVVFHVKCLKLKVS